MSKQDRKLLIKILFSFVLFIFGLFVEVYPIKLFAFIISYLLVGYNVLKKAFMRILRGKFFDENFLMTIATFGAIFVREYTEAVAVMLFYQIGELFQSYAVGKSRRSISELVKICPEYANAEKMGKFEKILPEEINIGDILIVKPGEKVPVDGVIVMGETSFDTSPLTGESMPRYCKSGDYVRSGFINQNGLIKIKAEKEFSDSTVMKILELVENSSLTKAKSERFITRFSYYYTPTVVIMALCLVFIPTIFVGNFRIWLYRALSFLVISCPCALVISVPLSFFGGIGGASRNGILIKGANYLETLANCNVVAFDKTGTLTKGKFCVTKINPMVLNEEEFKEFLGGAESGSNHPIALAITKDFKTAKTISDVSEMPGRGVKAIIDGKVVLAGNKQFMEENGVLVSKANEDGVVVYLSVDNKYSGYAVVSDSLRDEAGSTVKQLYHSGINKIIMLTGDNKENAEKFARKLLIRDVNAELMPLDKVNALKELIENNYGKVLFIGDGINDAPVLAVSDVGIALGGIGSDAAIEAADIVIMDDNLSKINTAIQISKKTMRIVKQNIIFAVGIKIIVLLLSSVGVTNMWAAVFADVGVAVLAILNSMKTLKKVG